TSASWSWSTGSGTSAIQHYAWGLNATRSVVRFPGKFPRTLHLAPSVTGPERCPTSGKHTETAAGIPRRHDLEQALFPATNRGHFEIRTVEFRGPRGPSRTLTAGGRRLGMYGGSTGRAAGDRPGMR